TGKTQALDLFYSTLPVRHKRRVHFHQFVHSAFVKLADWGRLDAASVGRRAGELAAASAPASTTTPATAAVAREFAREAAVWCFDEFQVTDVATATVLRQVFAEMFRLGAVMVATSNRQPDELYQGGWQPSIYRPFVDLLKDRCEAFHLRSETDYRTVMQQGNIN
ncbi:Lactation elevated protein 1, partial [Cladochytrium tenue]